MIQRIVAALVSVSALILTLSAPSAVAVEPQVDRASAAAQAPYPWPAVSPSPEVWDTKSNWTAAQATAWVNRCPKGRYCTWIRHSRSSTTYSLFQFYRCQVYSLTNFLGTSNYFNNQNRRVELLGSRHEHLRYHVAGRKFVTKWDRVWYIDLCA